MSANIDVVIWVARNVVCQMLGFWLYLNTVLSGLYNSLATVLRLDNVAL